MVHISFMLGKFWWGKGYATEAMMEIIRFFFDDVGVNRIEGRNSPQNPASGKVMQKCGFQYEGLLRQGGRNSYGLVDCEQYAILAEDYFSAKTDEKRDNADFWTVLTDLIKSSEIVVDRPKGSKHPRFDFIYPMDYGYLKNTAFPDGDGIDVWIGTRPESNSGVYNCDAIICTVDLLKKDSEIKILLNCTEAEKDTIMAFHNDSDNMKGVMIRRS